MRITLTLCIYHSPRVSSYRGPLYPGGVPAILPWLDRASTSFMHHKVLMRHNQPRARQLTCGITHQMLSFTKKNIISGNKQITMGKRVMLATRLCKKATSLFQCVHALVVPHTKIFCIGKNKTGTTSIKQSLIDLGYILGNQQKAERLYSYYSSRDFRPIVRYCRTAQAFQDVPFSWPYTYQAMDQAFPGSKFILSVRQSADEWYRSLTRFHAQLLGLNHTPGKEDLKRADYINPGAMWEINRMLYDTPEDDPYNHSVLTDGYERYREEVLTYFRFRPDDLLVINVSEPGSYRRMCDFLGRTPAYAEFPWLNKTQQQEETG